MLSFKSFLNEFDVTTPALWLAGAVGSTLVGHQVNKLLTRKSRKKRQKNYNDLNTKLDYIAKKTDELNSRQKIDRNISKPVEPKKSDQSVLSSIFQTNKPYYHKGGGIYGNRDVERKYGKGSLAAVASSINTRPLIIDKRARNGIR